MYVNICRYQDVIMKQKRISEAGTQQLLLDTYNMKTLLLHLHSIGLDSTQPKPTAPMMFSKLIHNQATQIETILKLVGTPEEVLVERFRLMCTDGRVEDLVAIMTLKGIKKADQQAFLDSAGGLQYSGKGDAGAANASRLSGSIPAVSTSSSSLPLPAGAAMASASLAVASSVRTLTQDLSSSARTAVGNLGGNLKVWK